MRLLGIFVVSKIWKFWDNYNNFYAIAINVAWLGIINGLKSNFVVLSENEKTGLALWDWVRKRRHNRPKRDTPLDDDDDHRIGQYDDDLTWRWP